MTAAECKQRYKDAHPERVRAAQKRADAKPERRARKAAQSRIKVASGYGMTLADYDDFVAQPCVICGTTEIPRVPDHDHRCCGPKHACSLCLRAPLCTNCNLGIGHFKDDKELLWKAIHYLGVYGCEYVSTLTM
jgi:hypothetical protein